MAARRATQFKHVVNYDEISEWEQTFGYSIDSLGIRLGNTELARV